MDWKFASFQGQQIFMQPREAVIAAARAEMAAVQGWTLSDTAEGFEARGRSFHRAATARFRITDDGTATVVTVELQVERASAFGFLLIDVGGYYVGQVRHWLDNIAVRLAGRDPAAAPPARPRHVRLLDTVFLVLIGIVAIAGVLNFVVFPIIGLATGTLWFIGRGSSSGTLAHGVWARGISAALLLFDAFLVYRWRIWSARLR